MAVVSNQQTPYHQGHGVQKEDIDRAVYDATRLHLSRDLGLADTVARDRAERELERQIPRSIVSELTAAGIRIEGADVLDLGSGLGGMSEELIIRGASVMAIEPGAASAALARRRVSRHSGRFELIEAFGEDLPVPSASIDLVVSLQVLEHVKSPAAVLGEAWRVLRPGGHFYLACENYLAFREGHYQVPWFPLLPKKLGGVYLRMIGRSPQFLHEAVTYITYPSVLRRCRELGFVRRRDEEILSGIRAKHGVRWSALRALRAAVGERGPLFLDAARLAFKFGISELFRKPH
jgi:SAM-dependent methyltransferase